MEIEIEVKGKLVEVIMKINNVVLRNFKMNLFWSLY